MDRRNQLGAVAFGGSWSEAIPLREEQAAALETVARAVAQCEERDARDPDLRAALDHLAPRMAKGELITAAFWEALGLRPETRRREARRIEAIIVSAVGRGEVGA